MRKKPLCFLAMILAGGLDLAAPGLRAQGSTAVELEFPGALATVGQAINNNGDIVGSYIGGGRHGFVLKSGNYTRKLIFPHPGTHSERWLRVSMTAK